MVIRQATPAAFLSPDALPADDLTRRGLLAGLGVVGVLAACGGEATPGSAAQTKRFDHVGGTTQVPVDPQRIVTLSFTREAADLGASLVGTSEGLGDDPVAYIRLQDPELADRLVDQGLVNIASADGPDLEKIAALEPDLIITSPGMDLDTDQLDAIAPTVLIDWDATHERYFGPEARIADLLGHTDYLERRYREYDAAVAALRQRDPAGWAALSFVAIDEIDEAPGGFVVGAAPDHPTHRVLTDLGASVDPSAEQLDPDGSGVYEIAAEQLTDLEADLLFIAPPYTLLTEDADTPISARTLELLGDTRAVRADQVLTVDLNWTNPGIGSLEHIVEDLTAWLDRRDAFFEASA